MEFLDQYTLSVFGRLVLAVVLGATIGVEREIANKFAGMRTHALVALGAALFTIASMAFSEPSINLSDVGAQVIRLDPTRIAAQIVTGIGFLGAGLIVFHKSRVHGLTTAAGVWVAAAIGMAVGFELYAIAVFATLLTVLVFVILWPIEERFVKRFSAYTDEEDSILED